MNAFEEDRPALRGRPPSRRSGLGRGAMATAGLVLLGLGFVLALYNACKIDVGTGQQAVLIRKEGLELEPDMELAPPPKEGRSYYKGVQTGRAEPGRSDRGTLLLQPVFLVVGDRPPVRRARRQDRHPGRPLAATTCRPSRSSPSRARRGSSARCSSRAGIRTTRMPSRSSCTAR